MAVPAVRRSTRVASQTIDESSEKISQKKPGNKRSRAVSQTSPHVNAPPKSNGKRQKSGSKDQAASGEQSTRKVLTPRSIVPAAEEKLTNKSSSHWLLKAEPESRIEKGKDVKFSIDDLAACTEPEPWSGVRNHVAKNNMLAMKKGDLAFFYHSSCKVPGVVGVMEIVKEATPDLSAFDPKDPYYDEKSDREKPRWFNVHVDFRTKFSDPDKTTLTILRKHAADGPLSDMALVKQSRLSVTRVTSQEWNYILDLADVPDYKDS